MSIDSLEDLKRENNQLRRQVKQLNVKFLKLQEALVRHPLFESQREVISELADCEVEDNSSKITIIAFGGMLTQLGMPKAEFLRSLGDAVEFNVVFVKDFYQCWYQCGLLSSGKNVYEAAEYIKTRIPSTTEKVFCIGTSAGGFAAILFSELLDGEASVSFGPQTNITWGVYNKFKGMDTPQWKDLKQSRFLDLRDAISGRVKHYIYAGEKNRFDVSQVERINDFSSVQVHYVNSGDHNVAGVLKSQGQLKSVIKNVISVNIGP